jgi:3D (Asp-Asp-Asp) domain-containing protein
MSMTRSENRGFDNGGALAADAPSAVLIELFPGAGRPLDSAWVTRSLRFARRPSLRGTRPWTALAAFLCGAAGAIPFAIESHSAAASEPLVASILLDRPASTDRDAGPNAKLFRPGLSPTATPAPTPNPTATPTANPTPSMTPTPAPMATPSVAPLAKERPKARALAASSSAAASKSAEKSKDQHQAAAASPAPASVVSKLDTSEVAQTGGVTGRRDGSIAPEFAGRPVRAVRTVTMRVTAYSPDERSCGKSADNITASGYSVWTNGGRLVAADTNVLPLGSLVAIPGYDGGSVVPVLDRGGAIKGNRLDVLFPTHEQARRWGVRDVKVTIYEYADGKPNGFRENHRRVAKRSSESSPAEAVPTSASAAEGERLTDASRS